MRRTWILCLLMIALLPLRGWAATAMAVERIAQETRQAAAAHLPPCHQAATLAVAAIDQASTPGDALAQDTDTGHDGEHGGGHACSHCAICHGTLGPMSLPQMPGCAAAVGLAPAWAGHPVPARAPDLPFKPPRG